MLRLLLLQSTSLASLEAAQSLPSSRLLPAVIPGVITDRRPSGVGNANVCLAGSDELVSGITSREPDGPAYAEPPEDVTIIVVTCGRSDPGPQVTGTLCPSMRTGG